MPTFGRPTKAIAAGVSSSDAADRRVPAGGGGRVDARVGVRLGEVLFLVADDERLEAAGGDLLRPLVGFLLLGLAGDLLLGLGRQRPDDGVEEVAGSAAVRGGDRVCLLPAERVELRGIRLALGVVGLVDGDDDGLRRPPKQGRRLLVGRRQAGHGVDEEDDDVRLADREAGLLLDLQLDRVSRIDLETAGVDDHEPPAVPIGVAVHPVAGRPGAVLDDRLAPSDDPVEERRLPNVGPADDGDHRQTGEARGGHVGHAAPWVWAAPSLWTNLGSELVRPAGVAAPASASWASSAARAATSGVPAI